MNSPISNFFSAQNNFRQSKSIRCIAWQQVKIFFKNCIAMFDVEARVFEDNRFLKKTELFLSRRVAALPIKIHCISETLKADEAFKSVAMNNINMCV